jgi:hypothetical protein
MSAQILAYPYLESANCQLPPKGFSPSMDGNFFLITHLSTGTKKSSNSVLTVGVGVVKPVVKWHKCQKPQCPKIIFV